MLYIFLIKILAIESFFLKEETIKEMKNITTKEEILLIFDLDDTLYNFTDPLGKIHKINKEKCIEEYIKGVNASEYSKKFSQIYGLTSIGLISQGHNSKDILQKTIYKTFTDFKPPKNQELKEVLKNTSGDKWIFTNNQIDIAERILKDLEIRNNFEFVIGPDLSTSPIFNKPKLSAFELLNTLIKKRKYKKIYFFDDNEKNIKIGEQVGWEGILCNHCTVVDEIKKITKKT